MNQESKFQTEVYLTHAIRHKLRNLKPMPKGTSLVWEIRTHANRHKLRIQNPCQKAQVLKPKFGYKFIQIIDVIICWFQHVGNVKKRKEFAKVQYLLCNVPQCLVRCTTDGNSRRAAHSKLAIKKQRKVSAKVQYLICTIPPCLHVMCKSSREYRRAFSARKFKLCKITAGWGLNFLFDRFSICEISRFSFRFHRIWHDM